MPCQGSIRPPAKSPNVMTVTFCSEIIEVRRPLRAALSIRGRRVAQSVPVQLRVPPADLAAIDDAAEAASTTRTAWLLTAAARQLADPDGTAGAAPVASPLAGLPVTRSVPAGGVPSPGAVCAWRSCWSRHTARYCSADRAAAGSPRDPADRGMPRCPAHVARLLGYRYLGPGAELRRVPVPAGGAA